VLAGEAPEAESLAGSEGVAVRVERSRRIKERWVLVGFALAVASAAAAFAYIHLTEAPVPRSVARFAVDPPDGWSFVASARGWPAPSPDGRHVVIQLLRDGSSGAPSFMFWLRSLESLTLRQLGGTVDARFPFWSPDSRFIGYSTEGELRKLSLADEVVQTICALPTQRAYGADWHADGTIIFSAGPDPEGLDSLYTVAAMGGEAKLVMKPNAARGETFLDFPKFLSDGRRFFLAAGAGAEFLGVFVGSLDSPDERRMLGPDLMHIESAGEHILFNREGILLARPFDSERAELSGEPVSIASSVAFNPRGVGAFGVSSAGTLAYLTGEERRVQLTWLDRKGEQVGTVGAPGLYGQLVLSPDERRLALEDSGDLWVMDVSRGVASRVTSDPASDVNPVWSADGQELIFGRFGKTNDLDIFRTGLHTGATAAPLVESPGHDYPEEWTRDGEFLLFVRIYQGETSLWALPLADESPPELVVKTEGFRAREPQLSPDGRWLAYVSNESGEWEVYVEPFRRPGERVRVSIDSGTQPRWRADGRELFYRKMTGPLMAVEIREEAERLEVGLPTELFAAGLLGSDAGDHYAVSADGQRFLVKVPIGDDSKFQMHVVLNWESLLDQSGE